MISSVMIFVLLFSAVVDVFVYSQGHIAKKKEAQTRYAIAVANSFLPRSSKFKRMIIGMDFCCFTPGSLFAHLLKVCYKNNDNEPYRYLLGSFLKSALKA